MRNRLSVIVKDYSASLESECLCKDGSRLISPFHTSSRLNHGENEGPKKGPGTPHVALGQMRSGGNGAANSHSFCSDCIDQNSLRVLRATCKTFSQHEYCAVILSKSRACNSSRKQEPRLPKRGSGGLYKPQTCRGAKPHRECQANLPVIGPPVIPTRLLPGAEQQGIAILSLAKAVLNVREEKLK